jgi:hypothetical protein
MDGTSMAAPNVANTIATMTFLDPELSAGQVRAILDRATVRTPEWEGKVQSGGLVNPELAMHLAALTGMVRGGEHSPEQAFQVLGLAAKGYDAGEMLPSVRELLGAACTVSTGRPRANPMPPVRVLRRVSGVASASPGTARRSPASV